MTACGGSFLAMDVFLLRETEPARTVIPCGSEHGTAQVAVRLGPLIATIGQWMLTASSKADESRRCPVPPISIPKAVDQDRRRHHER